MFSYPYLRVIAALAGVAAVIALFSYTALALRQADQWNTGPTTISVSGTGEIFARPDIATFTFAVRAEADEPADAQTQSATALNAIVAFLEEEGVEQRDIRTLSYTLNPRYDFVREVCPAGSFCPPGERVLAGYEVRQSVEVKVRTTQAAGTLIAGVGARGATDVSGVQFTIDDEEALKAQARERAIDNAKANAETLAHNLGVRIVRMTSFWEEEQYTPMPFARSGFDMAVSEEGTVAPSIPAGEDTVAVEVHMVYEVR